jgi:alginate O-acetyltransferase complex protein AlgI
MSFASPVFLWYFMPATLLAYWVLPRTWRNGLVALVSLVFYTWGAGAYVFLLLSAIAVNYAAGLLMDADRYAERPRLRQAFLWSAVAWDVAILGIWKYAGFASRQIHALSSALGLADTPVISLALPIGISFFTFHHLSYVVDVYRRDRRAQRSPVQFVTYIAMFPQLIAGPIVRYREISDQLADVTRNRLSDFAAGFPRFAWGLTKKVMVADTIAPVANAAFATSAGDMTTASAWLGAIAYTMQLYFDFSGYSDMAIGLGMMLGFKLPENFDRPYSAVSITDFWRRWHMSLSRWFRDYLYIPLGGNRHGAVKTYRNLIIIFVATGFWHGANWTFLIWGLYHGVWMLIERRTGWGIVTASGITLVARRALTFLIVVVGWVFFRADSFGRAGALLQHMFSASGSRLPDAVAAALTHQRSVVLLVSMLVVLIPGSFVFGRLLERPADLRGRISRVAVAAVAAPCAAALVAVGTFSPFLYYQF